MTLGRKLYMANVGDSRGIAIKSLNSKDLNECSALRLTRDHKPDDEDEAKRILENNATPAGRIDSYRDHNG